MTPLVVSFALVPVARAICPRATAATGRAGRSHRSHLRSQGVGPAFHRTRPCSCAEDPPCGPNPAGRSQLVQPEPFFSQDVRNWKPGTPLVFDDTCFSFSTPLSKLSAGSYYIQAVMDFKRGDKSSYGRVEGNAYSKAERVSFRPLESGAIKLNVTEIYHADAFRESEHVKLVDFESKLLTQFHGQSIHHRAAVALPGSYARDAQRKYPVIYEIPGFGGGINGARSNAVLESNERRRRRHALRDSRSELFLGTSRFRRFREQRAARPSVGRGVDSLHRATLSR